jgi:zinc protease
LPTRLSQGGVRCAPPRAAGFQRGRQREKITVPDYLRFYRAHYRAGGAVVAIMGDITRARPGRLRSSSPKKLPSAARRVARSGDAHRNEQRIAHPASQSHI